MIVLRKPHDISEKRKRWQLEDLAERERALDAQLSLHQSKALTSTERATERYLRMLHRNSEATVFACWKDESRASAKKRAQILRVGARIVSAMFLPGSPAGGTASQRRSGGKWC